MLKLLYLFFGISSLAFSQNTSLTVTVTGIKNNTGKLTAEVYNSKGKFLKSAFKISTHFAMDILATRIITELRRLGQGCSIFHGEQSC